MSLAAASEILCTNSLIKNFQSLYDDLTDSEARFTINVREGMVELEGKESFVDKHLEKFQEIFKIAVKEAISRGLEQRFELNAQQPVQGVFPQGAIEQQGRLTTDLVE